MVPKFRESRQISVKVNFRAKNFAIILIHVAPPIFYQAHYICHLVTSICLWAKLSPGDLVQWIANAAIYQKVQDHIKPGRKTFKIGVSDMGI